MLKHMRTDVYKGFLSKVDPKFIFKGKSYSLTQDGVEVLSAGGANKENSLVVEKVWYTTKSQSPKDIAGEDAVYVKVFLADSIRSRFLSVSCWFYLLTVKPTRSR